MRTSPNDKLLKKAQAANVPTVKEFLENALRKHGNASKVAIALEMSAAAIRRRIASEGIVTEKITVIIR